MIAIILISIIIYSIVLLSVFYKMPEIKKDKRIKIIALSSLVIFIITGILAALSAGSIPEYEESKINIAKIVSVFLIAPVNTYIILTPIAKSLNKLETKEIKRQQLNKKFIIVLIIFLGCLIIEKDYIKNFISGLLINS